MGRLVDDLLGFSRMARAEVLRGEVDLACVVEEVVEEVKRESPTRRIVWKIGTLPVVVGDPAMLRLAIVNLVQNAYKYTGKREVAEIEIGMRPQVTGEQVLYVKDNGAGFDMAYAGKLFGVFQRLHRSEDFEGTGIGLANVRRIVQRHGGRTWAEGAVDAGATFYLALPAEDEGVAT
jgi:light-regulated signal transduction histidine kinase (bacteriophytochrome)